MPVKQIIEKHKQGMEKTLGVLHNDLRSIRTGRASAGLVENLTIDYYGTQTALKQMATIATPQADVIIIKPFDPTVSKEIEKAIKSSELSLAPICDGKMIRLNIPPLSVERRTQIAAQVKQMGEKSKISIRNVRRDANKQFDEQQKSKLITEDDRDKGKKDIDNMTKEYIEKIDAAVKSKSNEIMLD